MLSLSSSLKAARALKKHNLVSYRSRAHPSLIRGRVLASSPLHHSTTLNDPEMVGLNFAFTAQKPQSFIRRVIHYTFLFFQGDTSTHLTTMLLSSYLPCYFNDNPTVEAALAAIEAWLPSAEIGFDHYAFRTFGVENLGINSVAEWFLSLGYLERDELIFPEKKLRARWYSPPDSTLPRIFVSELKVEELSKEAQTIIARYTRDAALVNKFSTLAGVTGIQPWETPTYEDYQTLAKESEYASWVLTNGYALNHTTIAVHRLEGLSGGIEELNDFLESQGFELNTAGGRTKISPDGLLLQSSTVADKKEYVFSNGEVHTVPASYIEFAERLPLPKYQGLISEQLEEWQRRDGFEVGSADKIFESTYKSQSK